MSVFKTLNTGPLAGVKTVEMISVVLGPYRKNADMSSLFINCNRNKADLHGFTGLAVLKVGADLLGQMNINLSFQSGFGRLRFQSEGQRSWH